jgi:hypothetical protein
MVARALVAVVVALHIMGLLREQVAMVATAFVLL